MDLVDHPEVTCAHTIEVWMARDLLAAGWAWVGAQSIDTTTYSLLGISGKLLELSSGLRSDLNLVRHPRYEPRVSDFN